MLSKLKMMSLDNNNHNLLLDKQEVQRSTSSSLAEAGVSTLTPLLWECTGWWSLISCSAASSSHHAPRNCGVETPLLAPFLTCSSHNLSHSGGEWVFNPSSPTKAKKDCFFLLSRHIGINKYNWPQIDNAWSKALCTYYNSNEDLVQHWLETCRLHFFSMMFPSSSLLFVLHTLPRHCPSNTLRRDLQTQALGF